MNEPSGIIRRTCELQDRIEKAIDLCLDEWDLTFAEILGVLTIVTSNVTHSMREANNIDTEAEDSQ